MRGDDREQGSMFSYRSLEDRIARDHPLRPMRAMVDRALEEMSPRFEALYAKTGRPSIAPERLLRALLLQILFSVRSERQLMEQLEYNLLYRWFVGLGMWWANRPGAGDPNATRIETIWPAPSWSNLKPIGNPIGMEWWDSLIAFLICIWVTIFVALLCAYLASFFLSGSTIAYYLLRRKVDAIDFEDVYIEEDESDEMFYDAASAVEESQVNTAEAEPGPQAESTAEPEKPSAPESNDDESGDE